MESRQPRFDSSMPLQRRSTVQPVPLTGSQQRWWRSLQGSCSNRTLSTATRVLGDLDTDLLRRSLALVSSRHESLRTRIEVVDGIARQRVDDASVEPLQMIDIVDSGGDVRDATRRAASELMNESVDVSQGPLFRPTLMRLSAREHVLLLAAEHLISDAVSAALLHGEIWSLYRNGERGIGMEHALPIPSIQYSDYAVWLERTSPEWFDRHASFWRQQLADAPPARLPVSVTATSEHVFASSVRHFPFGKAISLAIRQLAEHAGTRVQWIAFAIYACVMSRWCAQQDLLVALASHGRQRHQELKTMIGFLANVLYVRMPVDEGTSFLELIDAAQREVSAAFNHYDFDRVPTFLPGVTTDLCFNWIASGSTRESPMEDGATSVRLQPFNVRMTWAGKLWTFFADTPAGITVSIAYSPDLFDAADIERMGSDLRSFAAAAVREPGVSIASLR